MVEATLEAERQENKFRAGDETEPCLKDVGCVGRIEM